MYHLREVLYIGRVLSTAVSVHIHNLPTFRCVHLFYRMRLMHHNQTGNRASATRDISTQIIANPGRVSCMQTLLHTRTYNIRTFVWGFSMWKVDSYLRNKTFVEKRRRHFIPITVVGPRNVIFSTIYFYLFSVMKRKCQGTYYSN